MPVTNEFTVLMEDRPGTLGKVCRALADRNVSILALHSFPIGEIARVASRLGEANININYAYCGLESGTNAPLVFFGVTEVGHVAPILERAAAAAATP